MRDHLRMPEGRWLLEIVHGITSPDPRLRDKAADEVTDVMRSLTSDQAALVANLLAEARLVEDDRAAAEAELHALVEIGTWHELPATAVDRIRTVDPGDDPSQQEYLSELLSG